VSEPGQPVTDAVCTAAGEAFANARKTGTRTVTQCLRAALEAAAPLIRAEERRRIAAGMSTGHPAPEGERLGLYRLAAADGALAERERIAAELNRRADGLGEYLSGDLLFAPGTDPDRHDCELIATTLRNTADVILSPDRAAVNLREPDPAPGPEQK
jgi:hypothetical protein